MRHCAKSRKVASSIPNGVTEIFMVLTEIFMVLTEIFMALGSTQPLTEMSTTNISWGLRRPVHRADNLTTFMRRLSRNLGASTSWNTKGLSRPKRDSFTVVVYLLDIRTLFLNRSTLKTAALRSLGMLETAHQSTHRNIKAYLNLPSTPL
jgi:hypothetical protein